MARSMTGYGKGEADSPRGRFTVEIRSVNHRYGEISVRMPRQFLAFEADLRKQAAALLKRGKIDINVQWDEAAAGDTLPQVDTNVARGYSEALRRLQRDLGLMGELPLSLIVAQKGVMRETRGVEDLTETAAPLLADALRQAVTAIDAMRRREGESLAADLTARRALLSGWLETIHARAPQVVLEYGQKLKLRLEQLLEGTTLDEGRLAQEVALMADRCDITEELVRLESHFVQFDETLTLDEPVGRKLDFLMQEMNREVNTIGSKSSDSGITSLVIRIKAEMEKMREQIQNIE